MGNPGTGQRETRHLHQHNHDRKHGHEPFDAFAKSEYDGEEYYITIRFANKEICCGLHNEISSGVVTDPDRGESLGNESIIEIDYRYLFGLLTGVYHWNNAEVGSQYMTTRVPDEYNRSVQRFLNFFTV